MGDYVSLKAEKLVHLHFTSGMPKFLSRLSQCFKDDREQVIQKGLSLIQFVVMNAIALRKVLKKYDKVSLLKFLLFYFRSCCDPWEDSLT